MAILEKQQGENRFDKFYSFLPLKVIQYCPRYMWFVLFRTREMAVGATLNHLAASRMH